MWGRMARLIRRRAWRGTLATFAFAALGYAAMFRLRRARRLWSLRQCAVRGPLLRLLLALPLALAALLLLALAIIAVPLLGALRLHVGHGRSAGKANPACTRQGNRHRQRQ